jgi:hypothetical protein
MRGATSNYLGGIMSPHVNSFAGLLAAPNRNRSFRADVFVRAATGDVSEYSRRVGEGL